MKADIHIQLPDAISVRKEILASAIDVTQSLKHYQEYLVIKKQKEILLNNLNSLMRQIKEFGAKVYAHDFGVLPEDYSIKKKHSVNPEEERLNEELRKIERKLKSL